MARRFKTRDSNKKEHKEGKKWKIVGRYPEFKNADDLRNMLKSDDENDVKIHRHCSNDTFIVKMRNKAYRSAREKNEKLQD
ncbi:MAG: hypothetical protein CMI54_04950 [Parcubacteria group bacterium]|nr:hypothetical protein [Parcubacteria group bacterium]